MKFGGYIGSDGRRGGTHGSGGRGGTLGSGGRRGGVLCGAGRAVVLVSSVVAIAGGCDDAGSSARLAATAGRSAAGRVVVDDSLLVGDRSTPDRAVQSFWRHLDLADSLSAIVDSSSWAFRQSLEFAAARDSFFSGIALQDERRRREGQRETYAREIINVDEQSETSAIVTAKVRNTTPVPAGATLRDFEQEQRTEGVTVRYRLEKTAGGWRITQVQSRDFIPSLGERWYDRYDGAPVVPYLARY